MNRVQNLSMHLVHGERVVNSVTPNSKAQQQPKANHLSYEQVTKMSLDDIRNRYGKERKVIIILNARRSLYCFQLTKPCNVTI